MAINMNPSSLGFLPFLTIIFTILAPGYGSPLPQDGIVVNAASPTNTHQPPSKQSGLTRSEIIAVVVCIFSALLTIPMFLYVYLGRRREMSRRKEATTRGRAAMLGKRETIGQGVKEIPIDKMKEVKGDVEMEHIERVEGEGKVKEQERVASEERKS